MKGSYSLAHRSTVQNRGEIVLDSTHPSKRANHRLPQQELGGVSRASNMLVQAQRLYEQEPSHQNEVLLKTARRLLQSLEAQQQKRN